MRFLPALATILVLAGCSTGGSPGGSATTATTSATAAATPGDEALLLDSFEDDRLWTIESADDHAVLDWRAAEASDGTSGLGVAFSATGKGKASVRKEVDLDLSQARWLVVDVFNACPSTQAAVAPTAITTSGVWALCKPLALVPGWNRDLAFALDGSAFADGVDAARWKAGAAKVERLMLSVHAGDLAQGRVVFDRLRVSPGGKVQRRPALHLAGFSLPSDTPAGTPVAVELTVEAPPPWGMAAGINLGWAPGELRGDGPGGVITTLPLALLGQEPAGGRVRLRLGARWLPERAGAWKVVAGVRGGEGWRWSQPATLVVQPGAIPRPHAVDGNDVRYFSTGDGRLFRPHGQNLAWMADPEPWFAALAANGGNWARVWTCPWHLPLAAGNRPELPDPVASAGLDRLFAAAARSGIQVQLVLMYHGMLGADWGKNPLNQANGGPLKDPRQFWTDGAARAWFRAQLDYAIARWSAEPALFAWELVNECELCPRFDFKDVIAWHREMAAHLKARDPRRHLVTTSTAGAGEDALWQLPELDFAQPHAYTPDIEAALTRTVALGTRLAKPVFLGELGRGWRAPDDQRDREGRHLGLALWLAAVAPTAGSPAPWWWDTVIQPNRLEQRFAGPATFLQDDDRRGWHPAWLQGELPGGGRWHALVGADRLRAYLFQPLAVARPDEPAPPVLAEPATWAVAGCAPGRWRLRWFASADGRVERSEELVVGDDGILAVPLPALGRDTALGGDRLVPLVPAALVR
jgi:hypothetical protein